MSLLRHNVVLLALVDLVEPVTGPPFRIRPNDGDGLADGQQRWWVLIDLASDVQASLTAVVSTSFDGVAWYPIATMSTKRKASLVDLVELDAVAPFVRAEVGGRVPMPASRVTVRLASDGPFGLVPG